MKLRTLLFIFSISMIGLTSMASTPLMEQKQKTTFSKDIVSPVVANVVTFDVISFDNIEIQMSNIIAPCFVKETQLINPVITIKDVGWQSSQRNYNLHFKQSNSLKNKLMPFVTLIDKGNNIRNDY